MITTIVLKKSKRNVKVKEVEIEPRQCCLCEKILSRYNKNKYDLCLTCLSKVQHAVDDIPDSKFANILLQMRGDINLSTVGSQRKRKG